MSTNDHIAYDSDLTQFFGWRTHFFGNHMDRLRPIAADMDVFLFGVFAGKTTIEMCQLFTQHKVQPKRIVCFDSFQGVPKELNEAPQLIWDPDESPFFKAFNAQMFFETKDIASAAQAFRERVAPYIPLGTELMIVPGFFNESLTDELAARMNPAMIVDVDVDIYTSTKELLMWLNKYDLMMPEVTAIGYDDWGGSPKFREMADGESRAHREMSEEYGLRWELTEETAAQDQRVMRYLGK